MQWFNLSMAERQALLQKLHRRAYTVAQRERRSKEETGAWIREVTLILQSDKGGLLRECLKRIASTDAWDVVDFATQNPAVRMQDDVASEQPAAVTEDVPDEADRTFHAVMNEETPTNWATPMPVSERLQLTQTEFVVLPMVAGVRIGRPFKPPPLDPTILANLYGLKGDTDPCPYDSFEVNLKHLADQGQLTTSPNNVDPDFFWDCAFFQMESVISLSR